jgi:hypothetical protein
LFVTGPNPGGEFYNNKNFGVFDETFVIPADTTYIAADTFYFPADTIYIPADTIIIPPDTLIFPADTIYIPADTNYIVADTIITPEVVITEPLPVYINNINNGPAAPGVPSSGPCKNCEYFYDNVSGGKNIEYDGITVKINSSVPVQAQAMYHFTIVIADAADGIFDSGVFIEGESFKSLGPAQFNSFQFLAANNGGLITDVTGQILGNEVYLTVPDDVDVSNLVASFEVSGVDVNGLSQISGVTPNNFIEPVNYHLEGYNSKDWQVFVETVSGIKQYLFTQVKIGPNPSQGEIRMDNISGFEIRILDSVGKTIQIHQSAQSNSLIISSLLPGMYFVQLEKEGRKEVRKIIVQ